MHSAGLSRAPYIPKTLEGPLLCLEIAPFHPHGHDPGDYVTAVAPSPQRLT